jgi:hypothetical protein
MSIFPQFARWLGRRGQRPVTSTRRGCSRPSLEALETRNLLSTLTVTNLGDTGVRGDGSLRGEIAAARKGDQIIFAHSLTRQTITLDAAKGPLVLSKNLTIYGPGAGKLTISGHDATQVFCIAAGATDTLEGLTIAHGNAPGSGGGILNLGTLTIEHSVLSGNHADGAQQGGGGILNRGVLTVNHSTLSGNTANGDAQGGGGILNAAGGTVTITASTLSGNHAFGDDAAGGIFSAGTTWVNDCTLSGNTANGGRHGGGAIVNLAGRMTVDRSTVSGNHAERDTAASSGGILNFGTLALDFSIVTGNFSPRGADLYNLGGVVIPNHSNVGVRADG